MLLDVLSNKKIECECVCVCIISDFISAKSFTRLFSNRVGVRRFVGFRDGCVNLPERAKLPIYIFTYCNTPSEDYVQNFTQEKKNKKLKGDSVKLASVEFKKKKKKKKTGKKKKKKQLCCCTMAVGGPGTKLPH